MMMDWSCESNMGDHVVPKNQEVSDRFPSPDSWLQKWGKTEPGSFSFNNKGFVIDNFNGGMLFDEVGVDSCTHDKDWSSSEGGSQESSFQQTLDYQFLSLPEFESTDDLYLSSLIDDLPGNEDFYNSYSMEPELQNDMVDCDRTTSTDIILDTKSASIDSHSTGSSKCLKTHAFSPSSDQGKAQVSIPQCNLQQEHCPKIKAPLGKVFVPSEPSNSNDQVDEETCLEESVLEELGMVMSQMTEKTRLCFRDTFYRLAKNSGQHGVTQSQNGNVLMETPTWTGQEDKMRLEGKKKTESETNTNTIDRTIANLLFNKMDMNLNGYNVVAASISSQDEYLEATRQLPNYTSDPQQFYSVPQYSCFSNDNEIPILCQGVSPTRVVPNILIAQNL